MTLPNRQQLAVLLLSFHHSATPIERNSDGLDIKSQITNRSLQQLCSCSPTQYVFELALDRGNCSIDEIGSLPGIQQTTCITFGGITADEVNPAEYVISSADILASIPWIDVNEDQKSSKLEKKELMKLRKDNESLNESRTEELPVSFKESIRFLQATEAPVIVNSVQFIEIDSSGSTLHDVKQTFIPGLVNGEVFSFTSASSLLNTDFPLTSQQTFIPETALLFIEGLNSQGQLFLARLAWRFANGCGLTENLMEGGEGFGLVDFVSTVSSYVS